MKEFKNIEDRRRYHRVHWWIKYHFGKADHCEKCECKNSNRYEWALIHGKKLEKDRKNFMQLCIKCHQKYDKTGMVGKRHSDEAKRKMSLAKKGKTSNMLGRKHSDETKKKISISQKKRLSK